MIVPHHSQSLHAQAAVSAELVASSISPEGIRLDTVKLRYPRMVHADFMTHRVFSRNGSSSRAMPSVTLLADTPYIPEFRHNQPGMQPGEHLSEEDQELAAHIWTQALKTCQEAAAILSNKDGLNIHKQWTNRMLEWFGYITVVVTATDFVNYLGLRDHGDAQDEIIWQAQALRAALDSAVPTPLKPGEWHLPFVRDEDREDTARFIKDKRGTPTLRETMDSVAFAFGNLGFVSDFDRLLLVQSSSRCARTSYNNFDGSRMTLDKDIGTFRKLGSSPIHASPFEHQGRPALMQSEVCGNFEGWEQFRKFIPNERIRAH